MNLLQRAARKISRELMISRRKKDAKRLGIEFHEPNYIFLNTFNADSTVIDVGCADDADFSVFMIDKMKLSSIGVDPTRKHASALRALEQQYAGKFRYLPVAVAATSGTLTFHESDHYASGSLIDSHMNMKRDSSTEYEVKAVTLRDLLREIGVASADFIKLDLEGAEYDLLERTDAEEFKLFDQLFIEFHHHAFDQYSTDDTARLVRKIENCGFTAFSLDDHNYLFYLKNGTANRTR